MRNSRGGEIYGAGQFTESTFPDFSTFELFVSSAAETKVSVPGNKLKQRLRHVNPVSFESGKLFVVHGPAILRRRLEGGQHRAES
jgi:hypothetical protein